MMRQWVLLGCLLWCGMVQAEVAPAAVVRHLLQTVVVPAYTHWHAQNQAFEREGGQYCQHGKNLAALRQQWLQTHHAWLSLQAVMIMPDGSHPPGMQVQFWPDKRNLLPRQVLDVVTRSESITPASLQAGSVSVRSLSASEFILFDPAHDLGQPGIRQQFCPLLLANAAFQTGFSAQLLQRWKTDYAQRLMHVPNDRYADVQDVMADLFSVQVASLSLMLKKLGMATGLPAGNPPQRFLGEAWRAGDTLGSLRPALAGSHAVWEGQGVRVLVQEADPSLAKEVDQAWADVSAQLAGLPASLEPVLADPALQPRLQTLYAALKRLEVLQARDVAMRLGVQVGFNATDGD